MARRRVARASMGDLLEGTPWARPQPQDRRSRGPVHTGYPPPRPVHTEAAAALDLHEYLELHPHNTWVGRVADEAMRGAGILLGDYVLVDRAAAVASGSLVAGCTEGMTIIRELRLSPRPLLLAHQHGYPPIILGEHGGLDIIGPVIALLRFWY